MFAEEFWQATLSAEAQPERSFLIGDIHSSSQVIIFKKNWVTNPPDYILNEKYANSFPNPPKNQGCALPENHQSGLTCYSAAAYEP